MSSAPSWHCLTWPFSTGSWSSVFGASVNVTWSTQTWSEPVMPIASKAEFDDALPHPELGLVAAGTLLGDESE